LQTENKNFKSSVAGSSLYLFAAKFFPALAIFLAFLYSSHALTTQEYARYQYFWTQLIFLSAIACIGFPAFIITYSGAKVKSLLCRIAAQKYLLWFLLLAALSALFGAIQYRFNDSSFTAAAVFFFLYAGLALSDALLTAFRAYKWLIGINILYATCFLLTHYLQIGKGLAQLLTPLICLMAIRLLLNLYRIRRMFAAIQEEQLPGATGSGETSRKLWVQLGLNDIIQVFFRWIDKFIFSFILAGELFAVYTNATIEIAFLPLIFSAVSSAAIQHWGHQQENKTVRSQIELLHYSSAILSSIVLPLFFFLFFFREEFLVTLFSEKYIDGVWIFACAQLVLPVRAYPFTALLQSHHRGDIINKGAVIDFIMACVLMYPMYLLAGLPGVALSFVLSTYWQAGYYLSNAARILNVPAFSLLPLRMLTVKLILYAFIFGGAWFALTRASLSRPLIFWSGMSVLALTGIGSLLYEWTKNKKAA
jgi:O-antigen/teichoic acid export membrane protein